MPDFRHLAPRFRAAPRFSLRCPWAIILPTGRDAGSCGCTKLQTGPVGRIMQLRLLSCTPIPPTPKAGPQRYPSYIISVRLFVRALGPSRANPRAPPRRRRVGPRKRRGSDEGKGRGGAHRVHAPPSYSNTWHSKSGVPSRAYSTSGPMKVFIIKKYSSTF